MASAAPSQGRAWDLAVSLFRLGIPAGAVAWTHVDPPLLDGEVDSLEVAAGPVCNSSPRDPLTLLAQRTGGFSFF